MVQISFFSEQSSVRLNIGEKDKNFQHVFLTAKNYYDKVSSDEISMTILNFDFSNKCISKFNELVESFDKRKFVINVDKILENHLNELKSQISSLNDLKNQIKSLKKQSIISDIENFKREVSKNLVINLRDYQLRASYFLSIIRSGFDFSVPGSGKTIISYAFYNYLINRKEIDYLLVVGPKSASNAWNEEYITCFGVKPDLEDLSNSDSRYVKLYFLSGEKNHKRISFINFEKFRLLEKEIIIFLNKKNTLLIIDEAHKVKNPDAKVTKTALNLSSYAKYRLLLTGTPMPNGYEDLFTLSKIAYPTVDILPFNYGELKTFSKNGVTQEKEIEIIDSLKSFYSRVSKKYLLSIGELKEPFFYYSKIEMNDKQKEIYDFLNSIYINLESKVDQTLKIILMKAILIRKMQASSNPILLKKPLLDSFDEIATELLPEIDNENEIDPEKIEKMKHQLEVVEKYINQELSKSSASKLIESFYNTRMVNKNIYAVNLAKKLVLEGKKVVIWDTFVTNMQHIRNILDEMGVNSSIVNGQVTGEIRKKIIEDFRNGNLQVLIASPATLSESISLHRSCQHAIYVNRNFNAAQFIQSKDRIHRINMPPSTTANYFFLANEETIDIDISKSLEVKEQRMLKILDSDEVVVKGDLNSVELSGLTNEEIISYFTKK